MSWRDRLKPASYKGVSFMVDDSELSTGRRLAVYEYPGKDTPDITDLGGKAREIRVTAYILGDDYDIVEKDLIDKAGTKGAGPLIHPSYGYMLVECEEIRSKNSRLDGGMAEVEMLLRLTDPSFAPNKAPEKDTQQNSFDAFTALNAETTETFTASYGAVPKTPRLMTDITEGIRQAGAAIQKARKELDIINEFAGGVQEMIASAGSLALQTTQLCDTVLNLITLGIYDNTWQRVYESLVGTTDTVKRTRFYKNSARGCADLVNFVVDTQNGEDNPGVLALQTAVRVAGVAGMTGALSLIEYASTNEAKEFQDMATNALETLSLSGVEGSVLAQLEVARSAIVEDIVTRSRLLSFMATYTLEESVSSLRLCNDLYGSIANEQDFLDRNVISNPIYVPAMVPLEVLING